MARRSPLSTRVLLTCAAIGVATGALGAVEAWLVVPVLAVAPIVYGLLLGVHVLPGIVAQEVLRIPGVALLAHLLAALVSMAFAPPFALTFLGTAVLFGGIQEGVAALFRYRAWSWWRFLISALIVGAVVAVAVAFAADIETLAPWAQAVYLVLAVSGPVAWTFIGLGVGAALRRAGITPHAG